ncbi:hypothetical protein GQ42DRAFT_168498 [Ramicandelaber brevisporus]|nr:hypothetical protein GQ42DRAFT_168498 [Ramicandelaber brevisporus]
MKFGKTILSQLVPEWASHYVNYKHLKKVMKGLESDGESGAEDSDDEQIQLQHQHQQHQQQSVSTTGLLPPQLTKKQKKTRRLSSSGATADQPQHQQQQQQQQQQRTISKERLETVKTRFFYHLERDIEKVSAFYDEKEADFRVRLAALVNKKRALRTRSYQRRVVAVDALCEALVQFQRDLDKLLNYVTLNSTGFSKILKKWDKRSKSKMREIYLSRQIEMRPFFNKDAITQLQDNASALYAELQDLIRRGYIFPASSPSTTALTAAGLATTQESIQSQQTTAATTTATTAATANNQPQQPQLALPQSVPTIPARGDIREHISRVLWRACSEVQSPTLFTTFLETVEPLIDFEHPCDDINERTFYHEAAIHGREALLSICMRHSMNIEATDYYGRTPLHYAAMHGHTGCLAQLLAAGANPRCLDNDRMTPMLYVAKRGHTECARLLLDQGGGADAGGFIDHSPLLLACRHGHVAMVQLLLARGTPIPLTATTSNHPLHIAAGLGHAELLLVLVQALAATGANGDIADADMGWTPLFHAAAEGHVECVRILLDAGCRADITDANGERPVYYAAEDGHVRCVQLLLSTPVVDAASSVAAATSATTATIGTTGDLDALPSLEMPPPIIPLRMYGHNYLDEEYMVQISLGHPVMLPSDGSDSIVDPEANQHEKMLPRTPAVTMLGPAPLTSVKLVITPSTSEFRHDTMMFRVDKLDAFTLDFELLPHFGSKIIGRTFGMYPHSSRNRSHGWCRCPLFDSSLKLVGELAFTFTVFRPLIGAKLEIDGRAETYWKSVSSSAPQHLQARFPAAGQTTTNPPAMQMASSSYVTDSSLHTEYLRIVVQLTRDCVPVLYSAWHITVGLPAAPIKIGISSLTLADDEDSGEMDQRVGSPMNDSRHRDVSYWRDHISGRHLTLAQALAELPVDVSVNIDLRYPTTSQACELWLRDTPDLNDCVDAILRTVLDDASSTTAKKRRGVVFSSFNPSACAALSWKQPNYPVFFCTFAGLEDLTLSDNDISGLFLHRRGGICGSVKHAVRFAKRHNIFGIMCAAPPLIRVPSLIKTIKERGLLLVSFGDANRSRQLVDQQLNFGVDAFLVDGILNYHGRGGAGLDEAIL